MSPPVAVVIALSGAGIVLLTLAIVVCTFWCVDVRRRRAHASAAPTPPRADESTAAAGKGGPSRLRIVVVGPDTSMQLGMQEDGSDSEASVKDAETSVYSGSTTGGKEEGSEDAGSCSSGAAHMQRDEEWQQTGEPQGAEHG
ncbi:hypothetical protein ABPG77_003803 [Micractinium sp. CCAP 211/92]